MSSLKCFLVDSMVLVRIPRGWFGDGWRVGFGLIGIITVGLLEVLKVLVAELIGADEGSDLGVTDVVELAHEAGGPQGEETLDGARERGHG